MLLQMISMESAGLVDVGTDHGMLPIALAQQGYAGNLLATDINEAPLRNARSNAADLGLSERIRFLKCDGLDDCPPDAVDTIVIAGLGGDTICSILDRAEWLFDSSYTLILQPMQRAEVVRYWLVHNGFLIDRENLVQENQRIFQMFRAIPGESPAYLDAEYICGKQTAGDRNVILRHIEQEIDVITKKTTGICLTNETPDSASTLAFYRHILQELEDYRDRIRSL